MASNLRVDTILPSTGTSLGIGTASGTTTVTNNLSVSNNLTATGSINAASAIITGNLGVGGVLTYEDVTNIDSVGVITARDGIKLGATGANTLINGNATGIGIGTDFTGSQLWRSGKRLEIFGGTGNVTGELHLGANRGDGTQSVGSINFFDNTQDTSHKHVAVIEVDKAGSTSNKRGGDLIFYTKNDNVTGPTEKFRISSQGYVTKPIQPAFHAYGNNSWTDYTGANNTIKLLNSECNIGGHYQQSGSDEGKFVVPVNGTYYFYTTIYSGRTDNSQTDNNDYLAIYFYEDGNNLANKGGHHIRHYYNEGDRDSTSSMSYIRTCTAGEKFYVSITCNGTGYRVYGGHSAFGGYLIG